VLAAPLSPSAVVSNIDRLRTEGASGQYGLVDAIDYTTERLPQDHAGGFPLPTFMAHHQGMSLIALDNLLNDSPMQRRFHADPRVQAAEVLLQERLPHLVPLKNPPIETTDHVASTRQVSMPPVRRYRTPHTLSPRTHLLSNGSYAVMVTNAGGGYSRRQQIAMTRWREDITADGWGSFCYVRDLESGQFWSTTFQPTRREPDEYEASFAPDRAVWRRVDGGIETRTEIVVSPEDDVELRRISLTNHGRGVRTLELTSYAEVVLAPDAADLAHPAFSNLFVETTALPELDAIICARRPRASGGDRPHLVHVLSSAGKFAATIEYETDRMRFVGRGRTLERPAALSTPHLSNTTGPVLDPIVSLRRVVRLPPGGTARVSFATGFAESADAARLIVEKYHDRRAVARALALASTHAQIELRHFNLTVEDTILFQRLAGRLLYDDPRLRLRDAVESNLHGQTDLWKYGISGDVPMLLVRVAEPSHVALFRELLKAHEYLRLKGLQFDLIGLNEHPTSYRQDLHDSLVQLVESSPDKSWIDKPGGVFLRRADLIPLEDQVLLRAAARAVMDGADGDLRSQLTRLHKPMPVPTATLSSLSPFGDPVPPSRGLPPEPAPDLAFFNGLGGFSPDGREYVIRVEPRSGAVPPAPWSNVVAHETFGFAATECGPGYTWSGNSHDNRLTPWHNDPVMDPPGEAVFVTDIMSRRAWSLTPLPCGGGLPYVVRHGQGYSEYEHRRTPLSSRLRIFVPGRDPVKIFQITLTNTARERRTCAVTLYVDWVLGENRTRARHHVVTSREPITGALLARNVFRQAFAHRVALLDLYPGDQRTLTGDRMEFLGRNGTLGHPAALERDGLSDRVGGGFDPCGAIQVRLVLGPSEERTIVGVLGEAESADHARVLVERYRTPSAVPTAFESLRRSWDRTLGAIEVRTPEPALDLLINRWLLYQTLSCRFWGRSGFYQSSGAFGFRDQLQDVLALMYTHPSAVRAHLLRAAARQFTTGDVQHWWHEPGGQGVRTRFSDDRLWLIYATIQYLEATGDASVLDEDVPFLEGRTLNAGEHEAYEQPSVSSEHAPLYEHCVRALALSFDVGAHGLPLMGTGDWNDGMNLVGAGGQGESVWLAWFIVSILEPFADVAARRGEIDRAGCYRRHASRLVDAIERAWDGEWYRRAYFDDGTPLGSRDNAECRIDAIAQSWSVLCGRGDPARARQAMVSTERYLVHRDERLVLLLTPPFDHMVPSPGYIQGYVPGVRENGGQYTHAALWTALAYARLGDGNRALELFSMINPINHTRSAGDVARYRDEPYVVAADVYSKPPHVGRGGWTWYTGSAGWMYRVGVEAILGITMQAGSLHIDPCIPLGWPGYSAVFRTDTARFEIAVENPEGVSRGVVRIEMDGAEIAGRDIRLAGVTGTHRVRVVLGDESAERAESAETDQRGGAEHAQGTR
jgi:cyclic beta-1,2-glucan synthetase